MFYVSDNVKSHFNKSFLNDDERYKCKRRTQKIKLNIIDGNAEDKQASFANKVDLSDGKSVCDPLGMYTGVPENEYDKPVQDVDDL